MDLAFIYYYANLGGVTSVIKSRMPALRAAGWRVHAYFESDVGGVTDLQRFGLDTVKVIPDLRHKAAQLLDERQFDLVTTIDMPETIEALRGAFAGPLVYEIHTPIDRVLKRSSGAQLDASDLVIVPSRWSREWVAASVPGKWERTKVVDVPNIIDRSMFHTRGIGLSGPHARPMLVWVGKIAAYKRWRDAVRVMGMVRDAVDCEVIFITGGEINERGTEDFLSELQACGLFNRCRWYYNLPADEMANLYRECHDSCGVVLSTSEAESFCLVAHEAMSCGVPVVSAGAGALPEAYPGQMADLLFDIGEVDHAARIMVALLQDRSRWERFVQGSLEVQKAYDPTTLGQRYVTHLTDLIRMANAA